MYDKFTITKLISFCIRNSEAEKKFLSNFINAAQVERVLLYLSFKGIRINDLFMGITKLNENFDVLD